MQQNDLDKLFDELIDNLDRSRGNWVKQVTNLKQFIKDNYISKQEIREVVARYFATKGFDSTDPEVAMSMRFVQETIRKELLQELKKLGLEDS